MIGKPHSEQDASSQANNSVRKMMDLQGSEAKTTATAAKPRVGDEDKILLRRTDSGDKLALKQQATLADQLKESRKSRDKEQLQRLEARANDSDSATTTSEVNSDDDAASIVSRLSQIVVEQEVMLQQQQQQSPSQQLSPNSSGLSSKPTEANPAGASQDAATRLRPTMGRVRSATNICQRRDSAALLGDASEQISDKFEPTMRRLSIQRQSPTSSWSVGEKLPEINVIKDADERINGSGSANSRKTPRAKSNDCSSSSRKPQAPFMRRNESSGFLTERGDLRQFKSHQRNQQMTAGNSKPLEPDRSPARLRSNTAGCEQNSSLLSDSNEQLVLNIRRSAWTLSDFDQTFNKSEQQTASEQEKADNNLSGNTFAINDSVDIGGGKNSSLAARETATDQPLRAPQTNLATERRASGGGNNLLIRAAKRAQISSFNPAGPAGSGCQLIMGESGGPVSAPADAHFGSAELKRGSVAQSITSLASSRDSLYAGFGRHKVGSFVGIGGGRKQFKVKKGGDSNGKSLELTNSNSSKSEAARVMEEGESGRQEQGCCRLASHCCNLSTLAQYLPIFEWLPAYELGYLWGDIMSGLAVAVLNISTSLSAALVAETDPSVAFRASIVNTFVYSILCSSRHTSFGSWSIMSQMLLVSTRMALSDEYILARLNMGPTATWEPEEYEAWHLNIIIMYTFLIGLVQLVCGLLNLGNILASFIPEALCSSMIAATAFTMAIGQLANMCGTSNKILWSIERNTTTLLADLKNPPIDITDLFANLFRWLKQIALLVKYYEQINLVCVIISTTSVILLFLNQCVIQKQLEKLLKRKILIPFELILLIIMIIISYSLGLNENYNVATCGPISIDFVVPNLPNLKLVRELWFDSLATALISYSMVYIMAKTYSNKLNYDVDCNQELIACGAGNLIGGLFEALPATASFSRTAGQVEAGGKTQLASIVNCVVLLILAQLLGHHVAMLPICVMSATLFYGFVRMMTRFSEVFIYWRICKVDFAIWMVTFTAIVTLDMINGFVYGFIFSILTMLYRAQNRRCYMLGSIAGTSDVYVPLVKYPLAKEIEGIKIFQFCGPIHYVSADIFERLLRRKTRVNVKQIVQHITEQEVIKFNPRDLNLPTHIILDFSMISFIDSAGIHVIQKILEDYQRVNVTILLASLASHVATVVKSEPSLWNVYKERFYVTLADAVHCALRDSRQHYQLSGRNSAASQS